MATYQLLNVDLSEPGHPKRLPTNTATIDFLSIKVGPSLLEIKETAGAIDFGSANLLTSGTVDGRDVSTDGSTLDAHLNGGINKHDASELDFEDLATSAKNLSTGSVENALASLDDAIGALSLTPTNYTAASPTIVASHLAGIDSALAAAAGTDISDALFRIHDDGDSSKKIAFQASGISTSTIRTITMPDADVNLADANNAILKDGSRTFTADQSMGGFKLTSLGAPTANGHALRYDQLGANNGIATLDGSGKIPIIQLPSSVMELKGAYNATTNTPTLVDGTGNPGDIWEVTVAGTQDFGSGPLTFIVGDWVVYGAAAAQWYHSPGTNAVTSVNGAQGAVTVNAINQLTGDVTTSAASQSQSKVATIAPLAVTASKMANDTITDLQINSAAAIARSKLASGTADHVLINNGSGVMSSEAQLAVSRGGTNKSAWTAGNIVFAGSGGTALNEDATSSFTWDNTTKRFSAGAPGTGRINSTVTSGTDIAINAFSTGSNNAAQIQNQSAYTLSLINAAASATAGASIGGAFSRGTLASRTQSLSGDQLFSLTSQGYTGSAFGPGLSGAISFVASENTTASANGAELVFSSTPNTTLVPVERMRIKNGGAVNIAGLTASLPVKTNASKDLVSGAINLASAEVTGLLPAANGGLGANASAFTGVVKASAGVFSASTLVNADVDAAAAIAFSKLASLTSGNILVGSAGNVATSVTMSGEATIVASGAITLSNSAVISKLLTAYAAGAGTVTSADSILTAIQKIDGNDQGKATKALDNLASTAVNVSVLPATDIAINLGSSIKRYTNTFTVNVDAGASQLVLKGAGVNVNTNQISGVSNPSANDHAVNKGFADTTYLNTASSGIKISGVDIQRDDAVSKTNDNGGSVTVRQVVYVKTNGNVDLAIATNSGLYDTELGIVQDATIATTASGLVTFRRGAIIGGFTGLTPGKLQIVSRATAGALVEVLTGFVTGDQVYSVGRAISSTQIAYDPRYLFEF